MPLATKHLADGPLLLVSDVVHGVPLHLVVATLFRGFLDKRFFFALGPAAPSGELLRTETL